MQPIHDIAVGIVAILLGCVLVCGAVADARWLMQLLKVRLLVEALGPSVARIVIGILGLVVIGIGLAIAAGWRLVG